MYKIYYAEEVIEDLTETHAFIAKRDYAKRADSFLRDIILSIESLRELPYRFRKSFY